MLEIEREKCLNILTPNDIVEKKRKIPAGGKCLKIVPQNVMADERWASSRAVAEYKTVHLHSEKVNAVAKFVMVVLNISVLTFNMRKYTNFF